MRSTVTEEANRTPIRGYLQNSTRQKYGMRLTDCIGSHSEVRNGPHFILIVHFDDFRIM